MSTVRSASSRWLAGLTAFAAILAALGVALVDGDGGANGGSDGAQGASGAATTARTAPTASGTRPETTTAGVRSPAATDPARTPGVDTSTVVWPWKTSAVRYDDPRAAARGFAVDFAGFSAPVVGPFLQGDSRSGEVAVRPRRDGPVSTVLVRRLEDQHWWVIGSVTDALQLDVPSAGDRIRSPLRLTGRADVYEGHVDVGIRQDGRRDPIGQGYVTACQGELCPFAGAVSFSRPTTAAGAVVLSVTGGEDGQVWQLTAVRVTF